MQTELWYDYYFALTSQNDTPSQEASLKRTSERSKRDAVKI